MTDNMSATERVAAIRERVDHLPMESAERSDIAFLLYVLEATEAKMFAYQEAAAQSHRAATMEHKRVLDLRYRSIEHWLYQLECSLIDHVDVAHCACGWTSEVAASVGEAVKAHVDHVFEQREAAGA